MVLPSTFLFCCIPCPETRAIARAHVHTSSCPHVCKIPSTSEKSPLPTSLSTVQSHMRSWDFFVAAATLVTVTFCFHSYALSCFILYKAPEMLQQQETLYFLCTNLGSHVQFQIITSNLSCELTLLHQFPSGMDTH